MKDIRSYCLLSTIILCLVFTGLKVACNIIEVGNQIVPSDKGINVPGNTFLFAKQIPQDGVVVGVTSFFRNRNPMTLQIWRPVNSSQEPTFTLEHSSLIYPRQTDIVDTVPMEDFLLTGSDLCLQVKAGDRLGVAIETVPSSVTYDWSFQSSQALVHSVSEPSLYPQIGDLVVFDSLYFPFQFSVMVKIELGDLDENGSRKPPTCRSVLDSRRTDEVTMTLAYMETGVTEAPCKEGPPGPIGAPGYNGTDGLQGPSGSKGDKGEVGITGQPGPRGPAGQDGATGPKGDRGDTGVAGSPGLKGDPGSPGIPGPTGAKGEQGDQGWTGQQGDVGPKGEEGPAGPIGPKGELGQEGPKGEIGIPGVTRKGDKGNKGERGDSGAAGLAGVKGDQGVAGDKGEAGEVGPQGPPGSPGPRGNTTVPKSAASTCDNDMYHVSKGLISFILLWQLTLTVAYLIFCLIYCRRTNQFKNRVGDSYRKDDQLQMCEPCTYENTVIKTTGKYETNISWEFSSTSRRQVPAKISNSLQLEELDELSTRTTKNQASLGNELHFDSLDQIEKDMVAKEKRNQKHLQIRY